MILVTFILLMWLDYLPSSFNPVNLYWGALINDVMFTIIFLISLDYFKNYWNRRK